MNKSFLLSERQRKNRRGVLSTPWSINPSLVFIGGLKDVLAVGILSFIYRIAQGWHLDTSPRGREKCNIKLENFCKILNFIFALLLSAYLGWRSTGTTFLVIRKGDLWFNLFFNATFLILGLYFVSRIFDMLESILKLDVYNIVAGNTGVEHRKIFGATLLISIVIVIIAIALSLVHIEIYEIWLFLSPLMGAMAALKVASTKLGMAKSISQRTGYSIHLKVVFLSIPIAYTVYIALSKSGIERYFIPTIIGFACVLTLEGFFNRVKVK